MPHAFIRKRAGGEIGAVMLNGDYNSKSKSSKILKHDAVDSMLPENVHVEVSASHEPKIEAAAPDLKNLVVSNISKPHEV